MDTGSWSPTGYKEGPLQTAVKVLQTRQAPGIPNWNAKKRRERFGKCTRFSARDSRTASRRACSPQDRPAWGIFSGSFPLVGLQHGQFK